MTEEQATPRLRWVWDVASGHSTLQQLWEIKRSDRIDHEWRDIPSVEVGAGSGEACPRCGRYVTGRHLRPNSFVPCEEIPR